MEEIFQSQIEGSDYSIDENKHEWYLLLMRSVANSFLSQELNLCFSDTKFTK